MAEIVSLADAVSTLVHDGELTLVAVHPGVDAEQAHEATGWLRVAADLAVTEPPSAAELAALRRLKE